MLRRPDDFSLLGVRVREVKVTQEIETDTEGKREHNRQTNNLKKNRTGQHVTLTRNKVENAPMSEETRELLPESVCIQGVGRQTSHT